MKIEIHVPVSEQSLPYAQYMVKNYNQLASGKFTLEFHFWALDPDLTWKIMGHKVHTVPTVRGSGGHALAVAGALAHPRAPDTLIRLIADTDTVMLARDWDYTLFQLMFPEASLPYPVGYLYGTIGTTYEPIGGFSSGGGPVQTYKGRPNATWLAIAAPFIDDLAQMPVTPAKHEHLPITDEELSKRYNLPVGNFLLRDVGWQIPEFIDTHEIADLGLSHVKPSGAAKAILTANDYHEEYQLPDGTPFVAHQRGSMKHPFRGNDISSKFYDAVDTYVATL